MMSLKIQFALMPATRPPIVWYRIDLPLSSR